VSDLASYVCRTRIANIFPIILLAPPPEHCFSIISDVETLDISVHSIRERARSIFALKLLLNGVSRFTEKESTENLVPVLSNSALHPESVGVEVKSDRSYDKRFFPETRRSEPSNQTDHPETTSLAAQMVLLSTLSASDFERASGQHQIPPLQILSLGRGHDFARSSAVQTPGDSLASIQSSRFHSSGFADNCLQKDLQGLKQIQDPSTSHLNLVPSDSNMDEREGLLSSPQLYFGVAPANSSFICPGKSDQQNIPVPATNQHTGNLEPPRSEFDTSHFTCDNHLVTDMPNYFTSDLKDLHEIDSASTPSKRQHVAWLRKTLGQDSNQETDNPITPKSKFSLEIFGKSLACNESLDAETIPGYFEAIPCTETPVAFALKPKTNLLRRKSRISRAQSMKSLMGLNETMNMETQEDRSSQSTTKDRPDPIVTEHISAGRVGCSDSIDIPSLLEQSLDPPSGTNGTSVSTESWRLPPHFVSRISTHLSTDHSQDKNIRRKNLHEIHSPVDQYSMPLGFPADSARDMTSTFEVLTMQNHSPVNPIENREDMAQYVVTTSSMPAPSSFDNLNRSIGCNLPLDQSESKECPFSDDSKLSHVGPEIEIYIM
jgi:hypothetical protein